MTNPTNDRTRSTTPGTRIALLSVLGAAVGLVLGIVFFDRGPGIEPIVLLLAVLGALVPAGLGLARRRG